MRAEEGGAGDEMLSAALLHDIGHHTSEFPADMLGAGVNNLHDAAGAAVLAAFFPKTVTDCVRYHVQAKRYLCATDPACFDRLSEESVRTLKLQGGPMNGHEVVAFRKIPDYQANIQVRIWDDAGKAPGQEIRPFAHYAAMRQRVVDSHMNGECSP